MLKPTLLFSLFLLAHSFLDSPIFIPTNTILDFNNLITTTDFLNAAVYYDTGYECSDECKEAEKILLQFKDEFEGIIQFEKIDCHILKQEISIDNFPICRYPDKLPFLVFYKPPEHKYNKFTKEKQFPEELSYGMPTNLASLKEFIKGKIPSYRTLISNQHELEIFLNYYDLPHKVILFTDARETSTLFKGLNVQFKDRLDFGEIRAIKQETKEMAQSFNITKFPSLLVLEVGPHGQVKTTQLFQDKPTFNNAMSFLKPFARTNKITLLEDQIKGQYPQIESISVNNFSDIIIENTNVVFVHFTINDEEHYAWKELVTKLG